MRAVSSTTPSSASTAATVGSTAPETKPEMPRPHGAQLAGISMPLHEPLPADAKPGSRHRPWMRLTAWEMDLLRARMGSCVVGPPSEADIRWTLEVEGRGPENYRIAKAKAEATGEPFLDEDNLREPGQDSAGSGSARPTEVPISPDAFKNSHHAPNGKAQSDSHKVIDTKVNTENAATLIERTSFEDRLVQAELGLQMLKDQYEGKDQGKRVGPEETQGSLKKVKGKKWQAAEGDWIMVEDLEPFVIVDNKTTRKKTG
ncbi:MAG: hypothetical protein Q9223_001237 [Gallowayella weberi]